MPTNVTATPIWTVWSAALDNAAQGVAFVLGTGNKCAPTAGAGLTVNVAAGTVVVNSNTTTTSVSAGSVTPTSPVNNPRRDIVFISSVGAITLTQGTEAPAPVPPALPAGACLIAVLFIPTAAADYSAGFPSAGIEDLRVILGYDISATIPTPHTLGTGAAQAAAGNHTTPVMTATVAGHVPTPPNNTTTFLRGDATFATPPSATATVAGYVPTPPNNAAQVLRGDATWGAVPAGSGSGVTHTKVSKSDVSNITTTSTTFVTVTGMSIAYTSAHASNPIRVEALAPYLFNNTSDDSVNLQIYNSTDAAAIQTSLHQFTATNNRIEGGICVAAWTTLPASAKTIVLQWKVSAGTGQIGCGSTLVGTDSILQLAFLEVRSSG